MSVVETRRTACNRDCPDACGLEVTVEDGRATALRGVADDPITRGFLCERTNLFLNRQYAAERFRQPMWRREKGAPLTPLGWDAALDLVAERMLRFRDEDGAASILHYKSGGSLGILKCLGSLLFEQFGPVTIKRGDICSGAGEAAQERDFGICESSDINDLVNAKTILLWGKNVHTSSPHLLPILNQARRAGARLLGMDPIRTRAAKLCDVFVQPRPGADFDLAMAIARFIYDHDAVDPAAADYCRNLDAHRELAEQRTFAEWCARADVPAVDVEGIAARYVDATPATILVGWGLARRRNGAATVRALDALGAISGNIGRPGASVSYNFSRQAAFDREFIGGLAAAPRSFSEARLGPEILAASDPPVRMIWVTAGNPVSMLPDAAAVARAFEQTEFTVVVETHPTDTTDRADLVLPTLTLLEDDDLLGAFGNHQLRASTPAIAPPTAPDGSRGPRHELDLWQDLACRIGVGDALAGTIGDWKRRLTRRLHDAGVTLTDLEQRSVTSPFVEPVLFAGRKFATADGRVDLIDAEAAPPPETTADYPLTVLAASTPKAQSSQWAIAPSPGPIAARLNPQAAAGFPDGARARLETTVGSLEVTVLLDDRVRVDVVLLPKGGMLRDGQCANVLIEAEETDLGGGAAYYDQSARLVAP